MTTRIEAIARWATELTFRDIPSDVVELCRAQRKSVLAAIAASSGDAASRHVLDAVASFACDGPAPLVGTDRYVKTEDAVYAAAALSIALDFDDYVCFGHTGHSAVLVPLLLAAETGAPGRDQLVAQVVANEVGARLGGACLIGPQNGQLWSFIHAAEAALSAARLFHLDADRTAHALALSLYQPARATLPGFMAPDSKLLTASEPAVAGMRAARLAACGVTGPLDVLDHPDGFLSAFAHAPIPGMLSGLGDGWATKTLCVKPYPGCAYLDTTLDALVALGPLGPDEIESVVVDAGMLTTGMDSMSSEYADLDSGAPTPVTVNFSVAWNVAILILAGEVTPRQLNTRWLAAHADELSSITERVRLNHDWDLTRSSVASFNRLVPVDALIAEAGIGSIGRTISLARNRSRTPPFALGRMDPLAAIRDIRGITSVLDIRSLAMASPGLIAALVRQGLGGLGSKADHPAGSATAKRFWDAESLEKFTMRFPARVRVRRAGKKEESALVSIPRGGCGHPDAGPCQVAEDKLACWGPLLWGANGIESISHAVDVDEGALWKQLAVATKPLERVFTHLEDARR